MITVLKPGLLTTIQDLGRIGFQRFGIIVSGAMDSYSHRIANLLVGNEESLPTLEITLLGPHLRFEADALISICGANLSPAIDGVPLRLWRPCMIKRGQELTFGAVKNGCRAYIAIAGGFIVPSVMNSTSTYLRGNLGGFKGRALQIGDSLAFGATSRSLHKVNWSIAYNARPPLHHSPVIHIMKGRQFHLFSEESKHRLLTLPYEITHQSDRMGYRLNGPHLEIDNPSEMLSEAVSYGTIQVPAEGNPIILLADRQTTGGYPKIAQIASIDYSTIAQAKPGDKITFKEISHNEAQQLYLEMERKIQYVKQGILLNWG